MIIAHARAEITAIVPDRRLADAPVGLFGDCNLIHEVIGGAEAIGGDMAVLAIVEDDFLAE